VVEFAHPEGGRYKIRRDEKDGACIAKQLRRAAKTAEGAAMVLGGWGSYATKC